MLVKLGVVLLLLIVLVFGIGYCIHQVKTGATLVKNETNITSDIVVQQIQAVAKLVSTEVFASDVIDYENTWYGSTKRSLVKVNGRLLAGVDLLDNPDVTIDHEGKRIIIRIAPAKLIALEVLEFNTYDEHGGLWNPFTPKDRDDIRRLAVTHLKAAGMRLEILRHANESAIEHLRMLLARDEYTVDVAIRGK
ncbi:MAG: DUF4230 domain-containing protein [bacterium]|nr:DUF4230 domain-containing protein [bacterium]